MSGEKDAARTAGGQHGQDDSDEQGQQAGAGRPRVPERPGAAPESIAEAVAQEEETPGTQGQQQIVKRLEPLFDGAILVIYLVVGAALLVVAIATIVYALVTIPSSLTHGVPATLSNLISEFLLALIVVELLRTIMTYISTRTTSIRPFLIVAAISSVRRILSISADLSLVEDMENGEFQRAMIELGAESAIILVTALALYLFSQREAG